MQKELYYLYVVFIDLEKAWQNVAAGDLEVYSGNCAKKYVSMVKSTSDTRQEKRRSVTPLIVWGCTGGPR